MAKNNWKKIAAGLFAAGFLVNGLGLWGADRALGMEDQKLILPQRGELRRGEVTRVVNGDTVLVLADGERMPRRVKLIGVEIPEGKSAKGFEWDESMAAREYTRMGLEGKQVWLEYDFGALDRYSRHLAYVWTTEPEWDMRGRLEDEKAIRKSMFNARLILNGYGRVESEKPNSRYRELFEAFQGEAQEKKYGIWRKELTAQEEKLEIGNINTDSIGRLKRIQGLNEEFAGEDSGVSEDSRGLPEH